MASNHALGFRSCAFPVTLSWSSVIVWAPSASRPPKKYSALRPGTSEHESRGINRSWTNNTLLNVNPQDKKMSIQHRATEGNCCSFHCLLQATPTPPEHHTGHVQNTLMALGLSHHNLPSSGGAEHLQGGSTLQAGLGKQEELEATAFTPLNSNTDIWLFS